MIKYKYYFLNDKNQEAIGYVYAENYHDAYFIASQIKNLSVNNFRKIFDIIAV